MTEKTLNIGLGKPVATATLRPKTGLSQRQHGVQAYRAGVGQHLSQCAQHHRDGWALLWLKATHMRRSGWWA